MEFISGKSLFVFIWFSPLFIRPIYAVFERRQHKATHSSGWSVCALRMKMNWQKKKRNSTNTHTHEYNMSDQRLNHLPKLCFVEIWFRIETEAFLHSISLFSLRFFFFLFEVFCLYSFAAVQNRIVDDLYYRTSSENPLECLKCCVITVNNVILID